MVLDEPDQAGGVDVDVRWIGVDPYARDVGGRGRTGKGGSWTRHKEEPDERDKDDP
jgi:hypothetical protein